MLRALFGHVHVRPADDAGRRMLSLAAAYNLAAVPIVLIASRLAPSILGLQPTTASQRLYVDLTAWLIACFGLGYALAARDLARFWPLVALGAFAKVGVFVLAFGYVAFGAAAPLVALLATGDAIFTVLFVRVLSRHSESTTSRPGDPA